MNTVSGGQFQQLSPMIYTNEIEETIAFYTKILGFTCTGHSREWGWARVTKDKVAIMISRPNDHIPFGKPNFTGSFYIYTSEVKELWESLKESATVAYPLETFDYGMCEFGILDNNGYLLQFGEQIVGK